MMRLRISNQRTAASASSNRKEGWVSLIQSQRKWLQHLDDVELETNILLQKIKQDHFYLHVFVGGSPLCLFGAGGYILRYLETSFLDKSI